LVVPGGFNVQYLGEFSDMLTPLWAEALKMEVERVRMARTSKAHRAIGRMSAFSVNYYF
jgi:hypothetical protein